MKEALAPVRFRRGVSKVPAGDVAVPPRLSSRMSPSLIGRLGQARFPSLFRIVVAHPGHASLRSLGDAAWDIAARMCRIGSGEPCFGTRLKAQETYSASSTDLVR